MHAARRFMEFLVSSGLNFPVIHHVVQPKTVSKDELILRAGSEVRTDGQHGLFPSMSGRAGWPV